MRSEALSAVIGMHFKQQASAASLPIRPVAALAVHLAAELPDRGARLMGAVLGVLALVLAGGLLLGTVMHNRALQEFDVAQTDQHRRIKSFVSEVRHAAEVLRDERGDCPTGPTTKRAACLRDAAHASQAAIAAARMRYAIDRPPRFPDPISPPSAGR